MAYFTINQILDRLQIGRTTFFYLREHDDPEVRFPPPSFSIGSSPRWDRAEVLKWEQRMKKSPELLAKAFRAQRRTQKPKLKPGDEDDDEG